METALLIALIGIGATLTMDLWTVLRQQLLGIPPLNYGLVGRWLAYLPKGQFRHQSIIATTPVRGEQIIGWSAHFLTGIAFAALLVAVTGIEWLQNPTIAPALAVGIVTLVAPFFILQPGMGAGIAASKTPKPNVARLQSLITHTIFGLGLYLSGLGVELYLMV